MEHTFNGLDDDAHYYIRVENEPPGSFTKEYGLSGVLTIG